MLDLGFDAVGRPNNRAGSHYINAMIDGHDRAVVIVADKDEAKFKPDGTKYWPGIEGARDFAKEIKPFCKHLRIIKPPNSNDIRSWKNCTADKVMLLVENAKFV
jgi:inorganic pyrophosphatase